MVSLPQLPHLPIRLRCLTRFLPCCLPSAAGWVFSKGTGVASARMKPPISCRSPRVVSRDARQPPSKVGDFWIRIFADKPAIR